MIRTTTALLLAASVLPSVAHAQSAPTREEIERGAIERDLRGPQPALAVEGEVERAPCPLADARFSDLRFTLAQAQFSGVEAIDTSLLAPAWQGQLGQELPLAAVCDIRDRAATILRGQGYLAAVQVPEQTIENGIVRFDVLLARMTEVQVRGDVGNNGPLLRRYIDKLTGQPVFNTRDAERYLLLARDIPGLDVRLTLQPLPDGMVGRPGDVVGVFDVSRQALFVDANVQNYGSKEVGRFGGLLRARINGLTGLGDETVLSVFSTADFDEQQVAQGSHEFRLGSEGLTLGGGVTYAWTNPDVAGPDVFDSTTLAASAYARFPLVRSQARNVVLTGGFDWIDQHVDFSGLDLSDDKLRVGYVRLDYAAFDRDSLMGRGGYSAFEPRIAWGGGLEVRQGFDIFGASEGCGPGLIICLGPTVIPPGRPDGDPTGFLVRGDLYTEFRPHPLFALVARGRAQYSPDPLLSYEQYSGGNYTVGRGYDPGAVIGDSGVGIQVEAAYGSLIPATPGGIALQPYGFFDVAGTWTNNINDDFDRITSVGGGIRATIARAAVLDLVGAVPLERPNLATNKGDVRVLLSLTVQLVPWN